MKSSVTITIEIALLAKARAAAAKGHRSLSRHIAMLIENDLGPAPIKTSLVRRAPKAPRRRKGAGV